MFSNESELMTRRLMQSVRLVIACVLAFLLTHQGTAIADNCPTKGCAQKYTLALSWQPGFCETHGDKAECQEQTATSYDASNFTLHGLWPDKLEYCNVSASNIKNDKTGNWKDLPTVEVDGETTDELDEVMPGFGESSLERHEWIKHGTCDGRNSDDYYDLSVDLLKEFNDSQVRNLFVEHIGETISLDQVKTAFEGTFGSGSSSSLSLKCDSRNNLATEIRLKIKRPQVGQKLADLLLPSGGQSCSQVVVDGFGVSSLN